MLGAFEYCDDGRMWERSDYFYDGDGVALGEAQFGVPGSAVPTPLGSIGAMLIDWVCTRPRASRPTAADTRQSPEPSTAIASSEPEFRERTTGSAFAVSPSDLLTNAHVVESCEEVTIRNSDGTTFAGRIWARDTRNDLALISTGTTTLSSVVRFRSTRARTGDVAVAVGFPLSGLLAADLNVSSGIVSATAGLLNDTSRLQISAEVQPGNSGGPLLDSSGAVAGVVVSKLDAIAFAQLTGDIPQNINFAIKSEIAQLFLESQGVDFRTAPASGVAVAVSDIVEAARAYTFLVECPY